jgi:hypothetical protein
MHNKPHDITVSILSTFHENKVPNCVNVKTDEFTLFLKINKIVCLCCLIDVYITVRTHFFEERLTVAYVGAQRR